MAQRKAALSVSEAVSETCSAPVHAEYGDIAPEELRRRVAETAYFIAAARDFAGGDAVQDWLEAEIMVRAAIAEERNG